VAAWGTAQSNAQAPGFTDQTLRLVVRVTLPGRRVRIRLSNRFGTAPVRIAAATLARRASGARLVRGTVRPVRFAGRPGVVVAPGVDVRSDAVALRVPRFGDLAVSLHVRGATGPVSQHLVVPQTSYATPAGAGDRTGTTGGGAYTERLSSWPLLTGVDVRAARRTGTVVAFGDSITEGFGSATDTHAAYPDLLARRLAAQRGASLGVVNAGLSSNAVLRDFPVPFAGPSALRRLAPDVLAVPGARAALVLLGTNDLGTAPPARARNVVAGLRRIVRRLRAAGLRVVLATQTPAEGYDRGLHGTAAAIAARARVNRAVRAGLGADGIADFDAALHDPARPARLRQAFDTGDHLHPSHAGHRAMARVVDLRLLRGPCGSSGPVAGR
jgi:lysophospholipase L1-like esterase